MNFVLVECNLWIVPIPVKVSVVTPTNKSVVACNLVVEVIPRPDDNEFEVNIFFDIIGQQFPSQAFQFILEATR